MCAFDRDTQSLIEDMKQDEIEQMKIEVMIEDIQKSILNRSHLYINVIFVIFGAYALVLSTIYFTNGSNLSNQGDSSLFDIGIFFLCFSLAALMVAFVVLMRGFFEVDKLSLNKFKIKNNLQAYLTTRETIKVKGSYLIQLKSGIDRVNHNNEMYNNIHNLIFYTKQSESFSVLSLLCFGAFLSIVKNYTLPIYLFMAILLFVLVLFTMKYDSRKKI